MKINTFFVLLTVLTAGLCYPPPQTAQSLFTTNKQHYLKCGDVIVNHVFHNFMPKGNLSAGIFEEIQDVSNLGKCVLKCCEKPMCNVAFTSDGKCYHVDCKSNELCAPLAVNRPIDMVLVRPKNTDRWDNVLSWLRRQQNNEMSTYSHLDDLYDSNNDGNFYQDVAMENSCIVGINNCKENEICVQNQGKSRAGTCQCKVGFDRTDDGECIELSERIIDNLPEILQQRILDEITTSTVTKSTNRNKSLPVTRRHLVVLAENKEVRLPENEVTLLAVVQPENDNDLEEEEKYQFEWTSLHQPEGSTMAQKHQNEGQLHLTKLIEGVYSFKVSASTATAYGETFVNVTVLPAKRINKPPVIVITPANQTIKQPNAAAVIDASSSKDDDGIISWHWELQSGPLGYSPDLKDTPTLQLNDLTKPGNYSFKLTVIDTDHLSSTSVANITVLKFTDYPPEANAGEDKIIYLPKNNITLNGNLSTDDHAITTWEWTKSADDAQKAVDMQDTRTPYLQLSNLQEGVYTFTLKVTDSANQSSTAQVHVFVKPPTNKPPTANAGGNSTISLPQTWVVLDASKSTDDNKIVAYKWEQIEGPSTVDFQQANASKTNVTGLTKGVYTFKVSVTDDNHNVATDMAYVIVNQNQNEKPVANAGGNFTVELPRNVVFINGTKSKDDWAIVRWQWQRDLSSIAIGKIAEGTDSSPILILTDLDVGHYVFNLTVFDEQGLSDTDQVHFQVKNDPKLFHLVEITINADITDFTENEYAKLKAKLALLMANGQKLQVRSVERNNNKVHLKFYVETEDGKAVAANEVVYHLRDKLKVDASLLGFSIGKLQTFICQNNCSGHGVCNEITRLCECETFWMPDMINRYLNSDYSDSDCSWSILYVVLGLIAMVLIIIGCMWGTVYLCLNICNRHNSDVKPTNYKLIENKEDLPPFARKSSSTNLTDSDTDSDVVFESSTRSKPLSRFSDMRKGRNGYQKSTSRRVKT